MPKARPALEAFFLEHLAAPRQFPELFFGDTLERGTFGLSKSDIAGVKRVGTLYLHDRLADLLLHRQTRAAALLREFSGVELRLLPAAQDVAAEDRRGFQVSVLSRDLSADPETTEKMARDALAALKEEFCRVLNADPQRRKTYPAALSGPGAAAAATAAILPYLLLPPEAGDTAPSDGLIYHPATDCLEVVSNSGKSYKVTLLRLEAALRKRRKLCDLLGSISQFSKDVASLALQYVGVPVVKVLPFATADGTPKGVLDRLRQEALYS